MNYIRVFNKEHGAYFISAVYGRCDMDDRSVALILFDPFENAFILHDERRKDAQGYWRLCYDTVISSDEDFEHITGAALLPFKRYARGYTLKFDEMSFFQGWRAILDDHPFLLRVLTEGRVPRAETDLPVRSLEGRDGWCYLHTTEEANAFMKQVYHFHDACLEELRYDGASLSMLINAEEWANMWVELCFEGCVDANIRHAVDESNVYILCHISTLQIGCCATFFALDEDITDGLSEPVGEDVTWIRSIAVKWRKVEPPPEDEGEAE